MPTWPRKANNNREIAQALFVTEKTIETHLRHTYDKLGIRSRHKLGAVLAQSGSNPGLTTPMPT